MWYLYLRRDQQYLRSYRTHNLWLDQYNKKLRAPKIQMLHVAFMRRMAKSVSGVSNCSSVFEIQPKSSTLRPTHSSIYLRETFAVSGYLELQKSSEPS